MAEPERKTARSILAYERGARIAQRLTVISVLIGMTAIIFGGGVVWWAKRDLDRTIALKTEAESERQVAQAATDAAKKNFADLTAVNDRLVRLGTLVSGLRADDATGTSLALQEIDALLGMTEETELMTSIGLKLREMRIGIYVTTNALDKAIAEQRALNVALEASPGRVLDLAILQCRAKDPAGARETLRAGLSTDDAALLTDDDRLLSACGNAVAGLAAQLAPLAAADASMGDVPEPESPASVEREKSLPVDPGRNPAAADGVTPAAPASKEITKVFVHIRTEGQRASAAAIGEAICKAGFQMPGIEAVTAPSAYPAAPRVIFYHADQSDTAADIARQVEALAASLGLSGYDTEFDARLYRAEGLPRDRVEIWFGADAPVSAAEVAKDFKCAP